MRWNSKRIEAESREMNMLVCADCMVRYKQSNEFCPVCFVFYSSAAENPSNRNIGVSEGSSHNHSGLGASKQTGVDGDDTTQHNNNSTSESFTSNSEMMAIAESDILPVIEEQQSEPSTSCATGLQEDSTAITSGLLLTEESMVR